MKNIPLRAAHLQYIKYSQISPPPRCETKERKRTRYSERTAKQDWYSKRLKQWKLSCRERFRPKGLMKLFRSATCVERGARFDVVRPLHNTAPGSRLTHRNMNHSTIQPRPPRHRTQCYIKSLQQLGYLYQGADCTCLARQGLST